MFFPFKKWRDWTSSVVFKLAVAVKGFLTSTYSEVQTNRIDADGIGLAKGRGEWSWNSSDDCWGLWGRQFEDARASQALGSYYPIENGHWWHAFLLFARWLLALETCMVTNVTSQVMLYNVQVLIYVLFLYNKIESFETTDGNTIVVLFQLWFWPAY